jgi:hypothetical protein
MADEAFVNASDVTAGDTDRPRPTKTVCDGAISSTSRR